MGGLEVDARSSSQPRSLFGATVPSDILLLFSLEPDEEFVWDALLAATIIEKAGQNQSLMGK